MTQILAVIIQFFAGVTYAQNPSNLCPTPDNRVALKIAASISYNKGKKTYTYSYVVKNENSAALPIGQMFFYIKENPLEIVTPEVKTALTPEGVSAWEGSYIKTDDTEKLSWDSPDAPINPGKSLGGFEIVSSSPPGIIQYSAIGDILDGPDVDTFCPGHFQEESFEESQIVAATIGPVSALLNQVDAEINYKSKIFKGKIPQISPLDRGEIEIFVKSSEKLNVVDIDLSSIEFGIGRAKPKKAVFLNEVGKEVAKSDLNKFKKGQTLKLIFNLEQVKVRCNLDYALFLKGKASMGRNMLAALEMKPVICKPEHFKK